MPQELNFDPFFTPSEILEVQAGLYGIKKKNRKTKKILQDLNLYSKANSYTRSLSGGMKRRLMIAKALVHDPLILVLDEPTAGVDVTLRRQLWKYINKLKSKGKTILLTTHYIEEAEKLCDRICFVSKGRIVLSETKKKIMKEFKQKKLEDIFIEFTSFETTDIKNHKIGETEGVSFNIKAQNELGLNYKGFAVVGIKNNKLYSIYFIAAEMEFYDRYKKEAKEIISSVKIL